MRYHPHAVQLVVSALAGALLVIAFKLGPYLAATSMVIAWR